MLPLLLDFHLVAVARELMDVGVSGVVMVNENSQGDLLFDLAQVDGRHDGRVAIEDARYFLERRPIGLDVHEVDPSELDKVPELCGGSSC